jgi:hypothetical protein
MTKQEVEALASLRIDGLVGADLSGIDLSGVNLPSANLYSADLSGSDLSGANLVGTILPSTDLSGADLSNADLRFADLNGANLSGANLTGADLTRAILSQADLSGADLSEAFLLRADISNANLTSANFAKTDWNNALCRNPEIFPNAWCTLKELQAAGALAALTSSPHVFSGMALINYEAAPARTTVTATISNIEVAVTIVTTDGAYKFRIHEPPGQNFTGKEITFKVGGGTASSTVTWEAGGDDVLNLRTPGG